MFNRERIHSGVERPMRWSIILPGIYCSIAALAWIDFARLPPDGLANVGLMLVVLPVTLLDLALRGLLGLARSPFLPSQLGYYAAHAVFFAGSVTVIALALFLLGRWIDRRRARTTGGTRS
jgi:hypothetical protein